MAEIKDSRGVLPVIVIHVDMTCWSRDGRLRRALRAHRLHQPRCRDRGWCHPHRTTMVHTAPHRAAPHRTARHLATMLSAHWLVHIHTARMRCSSSRKKPAPSQKRIPKTQISATCSKASDSSLRIWNSALCTEIRTKSGHKHCVCQDQG